MSTRLSHRAFHTTQVFADAEFRADSSATFTYDPAAQVLAAPSRADPAGTMGPQPHMSMGTHAQGTHAPAPLPSACPCTELATIPSPHLRPTRTSWPTFQMHAGVRLQAKERSPAMPPT
jgi:hypothetical protein